MAKKLKTTAPPNQTPAFKTPMHRRNPITFWTLGESACVAKHRVDALTFPALFPRLDQLCDQPGPAGLMRGPHSAAGIAVEVFVEQDVVPKMRIGRELFVISQDRPDRKSTRLTSSHGHIP